MSAIVSVVYYLVDLKDFLPNLLPSWRASRVNAPRLRWEGLSDGVEYCDRESSSFCKEKTRSDRLFFRLCAGIRQRGRFDGAFSHGGFSINSAI